jgi:hypothetical protein
MLDTGEKIAKIVEAASDGFVAGTKSTERSVYNSILAIVKDLSLYPNGTIKPTQANIKILRNVRNSMESIILTKAYRSKVDSYLGTFDDLKGINDTYFAAIATAFKASTPIYEEVLAQSISLTKKSLLDSGINQFVIDPVEKLLTQNITGGGMYNDLVEQLRTVILGDAERLGGLSRYASQITRDALNQYSRNYQQAITLDLGFEWFFYSGQLVADSRSYCIEREGKYYHKNEVMDSASGTWSGKIPGTNSSSIFTYCGGFSCQHNYLPVYLEQVPENVVQRNIDNGNFKASPN